MSGKVIVSGVSIILVVGVAIGVVCVVNKTGNDPALAAHQKNVQSICSATEDQKLCQDTLGAAKPTNSSDPTAYLAAAVEASAK
ncbi:putative pectinesterase/pectinesterase inhibitor 21-like, partial [Trifolium medium]|nr:putative pectinesterase/pectinesterase inhibitor 21-like [Trifolium medium]